MLKRTDLAVERAVEAFAKGTFKGGQTMKLGLADGGVSLSDFTYTKNDVPAEVMSRLDELKSKITSGELKVWDVVSQGYPTWFKS
jgi:basic membrane protein A